jgi:Domain of unknown function (DUF4386)
MHTVAGTEAVLDVTTVDADRAWARIGRIAAYVAAVGFFVVTVLYLLDVYDVLDPSPQYVQTSAGQLQDEANFWVRVFEHQHAIVWDVIARDVAGPVALVALIVLGTTLRRRIVGDRPERQLMVAFLIVGGVFTAMSSLLYLGNAEFWRQPWGPMQAGGETSVIAVGRVTTAINNLTTWTEAFGYLVLALGVVCIGVAVRRQREMPKGLGVLAYVTGVALLGLAVATAGDTDAPRSILALAVGAVLAPWVCLWLGRVVGRSG